MQHLRTEVAAKYYAAWRHGPFGHADESNFPEGSSTKRAYNLLVEGFGVGYNGQPSEPEPSTWIYDIDRDTWQEGPTMSAPSMDHRGLVSSAGDWWIVGGIAPRQTVSAAVTRLRTMPLESRATPEQR